MTKKTQCTAGNVLKHNFMAMPMCDVYIFSLFTDQVAIVVVIMIVQLPMQSVPITTKVVGLNPADLRQVGGFLQFPPPIKLTVMI